MTHIQVTLTGNATPIAATAQTISQLTVQNNATHACRLGGPEVSATSGIALAASSAPFTWSVPTVIAFWYLYGTSGDVIDVIYG